MTLPPPGAGRIVCVYGKKRRPVLYYAIPIHAVVIK